MYRKKLILLLLVLAIASQPIIGCNDSDAADTPVSSDVDIDLTSLSSTMVLATIANIHDNPDEYLGQTIRIRGLYYNYYYDIAERYFHYVMYEDDNACCSSGFEFQLGSDYVFPDDYPQETSSILVEGVLLSYDELGPTIYYLEAKLK